VERSLGAGPTGSRRLRRRRKDGYRSVAASQRTFLKLVHHPQFQSECAHRPKLGEPLRTSLLPPITTVMERRTLRFGGQATAFGK